jgi:hypothetical protein
VIRIRARRARSPHHRAKVVRGSRIGSSHRPQLGGGFTLDAASQGQLDFALELGEGAGCCASFGGTIARDLASSVSTNQIGSFSAKGAPRPAAPLLFGPST